MHEQTLPALTAGNVEIRYAGSATRTALRLGTDTYTHVDGVALWSPVGEPWLVAGYRARKDEVSLSNGNVTQIDDFSGNGHHATQAVAANQPPWLDSDARAGGLAAWGGNDSSVDTYLETPSITFESAIFVTSYKDGSASVFDGFETLFENLDSSLLNPRQMGDTGNNKWRVGSEFSADSSVNGAADSATALPLPLSVLDVVSDSGPYTVTVAVGASTKFAGRAWAGAFRAAIFMGASITAAERQKVTGLLAHQSGIAADLDPSNPYRDQPPLAS